MLADARLAWVSFDPISDADRSLIRSTNERMRATGLRKVDAATQTEWGHLVGYHIEEIGDRRYCWDLISDANGTILLGEARPA